MRRNWIGLILSIILCLTMVAGCGNAEPSADSSAPKTTDTVKTTAGSDESEASAKATNSSAETGNEGAYNITWDDMAEINMLFMSMGPVPNGVSAVEAAINDITEEQINTHVNLMVYEIGSYDQQIGLLMSSGESIDLMLTLPGGPSGFTTMHSQKQLTDITELLDEYGQPIKETLGNLINATMVDGSIYAVPAYRDFSTGEYIVMRTDVLEDLGLLEKAQNMTSMEQYEEILDAVAASEKWSSLSPIVSSGPGQIMPVSSGLLGENQFADMSTVDYLGDTLRIASIDPKGGSNTVSLYFETEGYAKMIEKATDWYNKGYVYKDAATEPSTGSELIRNNIGFSFLMSSEYGIEAYQTAECGMPVTCVKMVSCPITTGSCTNFTWGIPSTAKEPEAAVTFLSMMYTDSNIANLLAWGIEGVDYEVTDGVAHFIEGNENPAWHLQDFMFGNQFLVLPWDGSEADKREVTKAIMESTPKSAYLGFSCDISSVSNEISALTTILSQYRGQLETGMAGEGVYDEFVGKLKSAGVDKVIACYQEQLDQWLADK